MNSDPMVFARVSLGPRRPPSSGHCFNCRPLRAILAFLEFVGVWRVSEYMTKSYLQSDPTLERSSHFLVFLARVLETGVEVIETSKVEVKSKNPTERAMKK